MKNVTKVLVKEIRRVRVLVELMDIHGTPTRFSECKRQELDTLRRALALFIKGAP